MCDGPWRSSARHAPHVDPPSPIAMSAIRPTPRVRARLAASIATLLLAACATPSVAPVDRADAPPARRDVQPTTTARVTISQVYGGGGNSGATLRNDFIELYNAGTVAVDLSSWSVQYAATTGTTWQRTNLSGTLQPGQHYLIQQAAGTGGTQNLPTPDATGTIPMSATAGKVALVRAQTTLSGSCPDTLVNVIEDRVGYGATTNCFEGSGPTPAPSNTVAVLRLANGATDTGNNAVDFEQGAPNPRNRAASAPRVSSTVPADGATGVAADASLTVTFSRAVTVTGTWYTLVCSVSGARTATVSGGPTTWTIDPDGVFTAGESCTATIVAAQVTDAAGVPMAANSSWSFTIAAGGDACALPFTPIAQIQGSGATTPLAGQTVSTRGVVVGDYEGPSPALRGFYLQDPTGDGDPATSEGLFVFAANADNVVLGDIVRVTGRAEEFQGQTQLGGTLTITRCGTGGTVAPVDVTLPLASTDALEPVEGMVVRLAQTLTVTDVELLGRFGQVALSSGGRLPQPTDIALPGAPALAVQAANDRNRILLDDAINGQNPDPILWGRSGSPLTAANTLRAGDTAAGIVGVLTFTWGGNSASPNAFRVRPLNALGGVLPSFQPANARGRPVAPERSALRVASVNLLNYYNSFTGCTGGVGGAAQSCRGAESQAEFDRQWPKTVAALLTMTADVIGIIEVENDGYGPTSAIADLVTRLNAATQPGTYAFIDADAATGQVNALGTDGIKVGLIYRTGRVQPVGTTAVLNSTAFITGGDPAPRNRAALAQAFARADGARFVVAVNHLKSKGSACTQPDQGDGQGDCNQVRTAAATLLAQWLATDPTGTGDPDVLIVGDLNAYAKEDPITALVTAGYTDLISAIVGPAGYSYGFEGQWGSLDHALASPSLRPQVRRAFPWHVNADEPSVLDYNLNNKSVGQQSLLYAPDAFRSADHDPIVIDVALTRP
jgi:predicted extracellular nuclease